MPQIRPVFCAYAKNHGPLHHRRCKCVPCLNKSRKSLLKDDGASYVIYCVSYLKGALGLLVHCMKLIENDSVLLNSLNAC